MAGRRERAVLDRWPARAAAGLIVLLCLAAMAYLARDRLFPPEDPAAAGLNPAFVDCRDGRLAEVSRMREEGLITPEQQEAFAERAVGYCADRFPPQGG